eukprot:Clim_evm21s198 gene=Clim_evmTU21s198
MSAATASVGSVGATSAPKSQQEIVNQFNSMRQQQQRLMRKIAELEADITEHKLVIEAIKDLDPNRKCYRMVGQVLVERNVGEVLPALEQNADGIAQIVTSLRTRSGQLTAEINAYKQRYNIRVQGSDGPGSSGQQSSDEKEKSSAGVLA